MSKYTIQALAEKRYPDAKGDGPTARNWNDRSLIARNAFIAGAQLAIDTNPLVKYLKKIVDLYDNGGGKFIALEMAMTAREALSNVQVVQPAKTDGGETLEEALKNTMFMTGGNTDAEKDIFAMGARFGYGLQPHTDKQEGMENVLKLAEIRIKNLTSCADDINPVKMAEFILEPIKELLYGKSSGAAADNGKEPAGWTALFTDEKEYGEYLKWRGKKEPGHYIDLTKHGDHFYSVFFKPNGKKLGTIYMEVDGYAFDADAEGVWSDYVLKAIGDCLYNLNQSLKEQQ